LAPQADCAAGNRQPAQRRYHQRVIESQAYRIVRLEIELQQLLGRKLIAKLPPVDPIADEHPDD
jgi:hypothetical protein